MTVSQPERCQDPESNYLNTFPTVTCQNVFGEKDLHKHQRAVLADNVITLLISCLIKATVQDPEVTCPLS